MVKKNQKKKIVLPPELPPEIAEDEVEVSDEDLQFVNENQDYAGFVSSLDTQSITKYVIFLKVLFFKIHIHCGSKFNLSVIVKLNEA